MFSRPYRPKDATRKQRETQALYHARHLEEKKGESLTWGASRSTIKQRSQATGCKKWSTERIVGGNKRTLEKQRGKLGERARKARPARTEEKGGKARLG